MGIFIAYLLGIVTAIKTKNHDRDYDSNRSEPNQDHSIPRQILSVVCIPPTPSKEERAQQKKENRQQTRLYRVQVGTLLALCVYTGVTILIWLATKDATYQNQRPWIAGAYWEFPYKFILPTDPCADGHCVGIYIGNYGLTPAVNVTGGAKITIASDDSGRIPIQEPEPADQHPLRGVLPNDKTALWFTERVRPDQMAEYATVKRMYVRARIEYCDIWDNFNWTTICLYHDSTTPFSEFWPCEHITSEVRTIQRGCKNFTRKH